MTPECGNELRLAKEYISFCVLKYHKHLSEIWGVKRGVSV